MSAGNNNRGFVRCTNCGYPQQGESYNSAGFSICPHCNSRLLIYTYPALFADSYIPEESQHTIHEGTATCFYHSSRQAVVPCGSCGRYLCTLCEIDLGEQKICPDCMDKAARNEEVTELIDNRTLYDSIALAIAIGPVIFWFFTIITAPISLYMTVRYWRTPLSILPRSRIRFILAFLIAIVQILLWSAFLFSFLT